MKNFLAYLGLRAGVGLIGLLADRTARSLGGVGGRIWHAFDGDRRRMAERHMTRVLGNGANVAEAAESVMEAYGKYLAEALWVRGRRVPGILERTDVEGLDWVLKGRDAGKGIVFAVPHVGNWEVAAPVALANGIPVVAVAEDLPNKRITEWFTAMRGDYGIEIVLATGGVQVMRDLEKALAANKAVALLSDRDLKAVASKSTSLARERPFPQVRRPWRFGPAHLSCRLLVTSQMGDIAWSSARKSPSRTTAPARKRSRR